VDFTLDDELIASLKEQISSLEREEGASPSASPTSIKTSRASLATIHRLADWRYVAFAGSLLAASIGVAAWWWSSSVDTAMMARSDPAPLTQAVPEAVAPKDVAPAAVALPFELAQQLQPMARDLAALRQTVEQLEVRQEQLVRENENLASQLKASREEVAGNNSIIDQIKATQIQMAHESQTLTERLNASQEQLARVIANASEPKAMPEAPKVMPEEPKVSPEEPKAMPEIPLPRPRQSAHVAQTQKPAPTPARPQAKKPQPSFAWPWSVR
jgi:endonuclease/exonuclease/phosphatase (EEP) superfamily protein YafD